MKLLLSRGDLPGGYFYIRRSGGLDLTSSLEAKVKARFSQVHQIRGKSWEVLLPQDAKVGKKSQFWGHLGLYLKFKGQNLVYLSTIFLEAKFGAPTRISEANLEALAPDLLIWKYAGGNICFLFTWTKVTSTGWVIRQ